MPVQLIPLERARAQTSLNLGRDNALLASIRSSMRRSHAPVAGSAFDDTFTSSINPAQKAEDVFRPEISRPLNIEESTLCCSYPSGLSYTMNISPYAPQADFTDSPKGGRSNSQPSTSFEAAAETKLSDIEAIVGPGDVRTGIQNYVDKAFNTPDHPLGVLMNRIEMVYRLSYGGVGVCKFLLAHAIAETHSIIQRIHGIVRSGSSGLMHAVCMEVGGHSEVSS